MNLKVKYQLYIGNNCTCCNDVQNYFNHTHIPIATINIDEEDYDLPYSLMIIPALLSGDRLIAYGVDIMKYFESIK